MTKKFSKLLVSIVIFLTTIVQVNAASVPSSVTVSSIGKINYGGTYYFPVKYTSDGTLAYCTDFQKLYPMGVKMTNPTKVDNGLAYIIANGYKGTKADYGNDSKMKQYYITQLAIYTYLGQANPKNNNDVHNAVWDLVNKAKAANNESNTKLNVSLNASNTNMKLTSDGRYFISDEITVSSNNNNAEFTIGGSANVNTEIVDANGNKVNKVKNGSKVYARIPASTIQAGQSVTVSVAVNGQATKQTAYVYTPNPNKYQTIIPSITYPETESAQATIKVKAAKEKIQTKVKISKQDITTKQELPGATLVIKDANGKEVASWVSTNTPKYIKGLEAGNYTLCETQAPDGYELYTECIKFTVKADGTVSTVIMYNAPKSKETKVQISKKDITSKEEIAGAKLRITDLNGKEIISWVSTTTPKLIKNLKPGKYYLEETQAPDGYILSTEKKEFEVKEDGTVTSIVFYNEKQETKPNKVAISKQDMTTKQELPGATLVIKDANGKEIDRWVSTNEVHYVELEKGTYTLTEVIAPKGYVLSTETITFTVDENGNVDKPVIMYNTKAVEVPITDANVPMIVYLIGALGMIFGFTKVLKNAKLQ
ncbi:MAG: SpaA isopeptide-forming pilin-related protein [Bacilli bacterium]|nr:SpaA isopeptide-forming pilin-related protein [Bacilli bacterium]